MIFQHSQCFQCFQCSKKRGTPLKNPPLLRTQFAPSTVQGEHTNSTREKQHGRGDSTAQGERTNSTREKQHGRGESTAQGERTNSTREKQHGRCDSTAQGERTSSTRATQHGRCDSTVQGSAQAPQGGKTRQERQLRKAGTRAAGSQKLRLWRSLF